MSEPRYLLAKYVPNLSRMEPRNIGVFLWHKGHLLARFLDAHDADFVNNKETYNRWVQYWTKLIAGEDLAIAGRKPVTKRNEACLDVLLAAQEGEYLLVDAGFVPTKLSVSDMSKAVTFLFGELVSPRPPMDKGHASHNLRERCTRIWERTRIVELADFRKRYLVRCPVYGVHKDLHFHYGLGNGKPRAVFHRVTISQDVSVNSAAFMFHALTESATLKKDHCAALIQGSEISGQMAEEGRDLLGQVCRVIDVEQESEAVDTIRRLVPRP
ncbi:MAG: hypothetical protein NTW96_05230 [Planctomycetia bacterium]|nr:hypothetical protein [Planctomycetia bacterium]